MTKPQTIAIDGPAASGKSTIGEKLAYQLDYLYFDTGVMYRAVTWAALDRHVDIADEAAITCLAETLHIEVLPPTASDGRQYTILADGVDITWEIRTPAVDRGVSPVSAYRGVRTALVAQQRRIAMQGPVVMTGRDIGTVVLPEAELKVYLDASPECRAMRRHLENLSRGRASDYTEVLEAMRRRDQIDSTRAIAPLRPADDAVLIDSTALSVEQVLTKITELIG
jgi:CMP/dCMP kinase